MKKKVMIFAVATSLFSYQLLLAGEPKLKLEKLRDIPVVKPPKHNINNLRNLIKAPDFSYRLKSMNQPVSSCIRAAENAVKTTSLNGIKLFTTKADRNGIGATTFDTRGHIICVRLPKQGACDDDGATAVIMSAGPNASQLTKNLYRKLNVRDITIDCGSAANPVKR